jgi:hypothetical protein
MANYVSGLIWQSLLQKSLFLAQHCDIYGL